MAEWPFSLAELTAGLRRYFAEPGLQVAGLQPGAERQGGRELAVTYSVGGQTHTVTCVLKEPRGTGRAGLAHPGVREAGVYRSLAAQLPMATPALIAADPSGDWLVLEAVEADAAPDWDAASYEQAVVRLAELHERFWGLADDLGAYPWLARPLTLDFEIHVYAAAQALSKVVRDEWPPRIAESVPALARLGQMISQADELVQPLRAMPFTLLHGDYWEGNLLHDDDRDLVVLGWQQAGIGPGVLDLVVMLTNSRCERGALPVAEAGLVARYREELAHRVGAAWSDAEWAELWDHALLWRFLQEMLVWVVGVAPEVFQARAERFVTVWLEPVLAAAERRLAPMLATE